MCEVIQVANQQGGGGVVVAVSLDIKNVFNSLPWAVIRQALQRKGFPEYIRGIIESYLSQRSIVFNNNDGKIEEKEMWAGVPQGSVLGPLLWNLSFDEVLSRGVEIGYDIIYYADDTLTLAEAADINSAVARANIQTGMVLNRIGRLGLTVAPEKTQVVCFRGKTRCHVPPVVDIGGVYIEAKQIS